MLWIYIIYIYLFLLKFSLNIFTFYSISSNIIFLLKKSKKNQRSRKIVPPAYLCYKKLTILYIFGVFKYFTAGNFFFSIFFHFWLWTNIKESFFFYRCKSVRLAICMFDISSEFPWGDLSFWNEIFFFFWFSVYIHSVIYIDGYTYMCILMFNRKWGNITLGI